MRERKREHLLTLTNKGVRRSCMLSLSHSNRGEKRERRGLHSSVLGINNVKADKVLQLWCRFSLFLEEDIVPVSKGRKPKVKSNSTFSCPKMSANVQHLVKVLPLCVRACVCVWGRETHQAAGSYSAHILTYSSRWCGPRIEESLVRYSKLSMMTATKRFNI